MYTGPETAAEPLYRRYSGGPDKFTMAASAGASSGARGDDFTIRVNDEDVKEEGIITVMKKTTKYGTVKTKRDHLARLVMQKAAILAACPSSVKPTLEEAYSKHEACINRTRMSADEAAAAFYHFAEPFRVWRSSSRASVTRGFPTALKLADDVAPGILEILKSTINHLADKAVEAFNEAKLQMEDGIKSNVVTNLPAGELERKYKENATNMLSDVALNTCPFCLHKYVDEPSSNQENLEHNQKKYKEWQDLVEVLKPRFERGDKEIMIV